MILHQGLRHLLRSRGSLFGQSLIMSSSRLPSQALLGSIFSVLNPRKGIVDLLGQAQTELPKAKEVSMARGTTLLVTIPSSIMVVASKR